MKKRWYGIIAAVMALAVLVSTTAPALAQSEKGVAGNSKPTVKVPDALGIRASRVASVGEKVTITVFQRETRDPIKDAGVWALTRED